MPYSWTIDDSTRTVYVRGFGAGVTADTLDLIGEVAAHLRARQGYDFVYNSSALRIQSSPADMMRVATAMFQERDFRFGRFAVVVPPERVALARIFAALAQPFGVVVNVFADEDTAREWLTERRARGTIESRPIDAQTGPTIEMTTPAPFVAPRNPPPVFPEATYPDTESRPPDAAEPGPESAHPDPEP